jgi:glycosyltransferase involved in cell wall biosynthesis
LVEAGVDVLFEPAKHDTQSIPLDEWWAKELPERAQRQDVAPVKIWHETPEFYAPSPAQVNVAMVAWETSHIPSHDLGGNPRNNWVKQLNRMQEVWTFSRYAAKAIERSGVTTPVVVIPHPIDTTVYCPIDEDHPAVELMDSDRQVLDDSWFKFISVFQWHARKDPMSLLVSYFSEFTAEDRTVLILKTYGNQIDEPGQIVGAIERIRRGCQLPHPAPRVFLMQGMLSDSEMASVLRSCDAYVTSTRAEGFCLPAAEALGCGVPAITPRGSSFPDFMKEKWGYLVDVVEEPVHGMPGIPWYYATQTWHRIQMLDLRRRMREAYDDRVALANRAKQAPKAVHPLATDQVGAQMRHALEDLVARARSGQLRPQKATAHSD